MKDLSFYSAEVRMKLTDRFLKYINPSVDPKVRKDMDKRIIRSIHVMSLIVLFLESALLLYILFIILSDLKGFDRNEITSLISVGSCVAFCAVAVFLSRRLLRKEDLPHRQFFFFKMFFFVLFSVWAIFADYRHYVAGDQILTFYTVSLVLVCFVLFRPWVGGLLFGASYAGLYLAMRLHDGAASVDVLNYIVFAVASIATNGILYHAQINISDKTIRLMENNQILENASHHDGLTGLLNRLALEEDAHGADGRRMTAYMADINYFKEINDRYGHAAGDAILREVSETLKQIFPGGRYYRYGGDEFLVLTHKAPEENYGSTVYEFTKDRVDVVLSIGSAQSAPASYQEVFDLISEADKALYSTKKRTHSAEFGGHDRRRR